MDTRVEESAATAAAEERPSGRDLSPWWTALTIALLTRAVFLVVAWAAAWYLTSSGSRPEPSGLLDVWHRWDAVLFQRVAEFGYTDPRTDAHATAFFPLFPMLMKGVHALGVPWTAAGMLISTVATVVALAFLYRLADEEIGGEAGRRAALYLSFFPTAVFLVAPYSEALFLAGAIPAFYYARRSRWHLAALPTAVAVASRAAGLFLLFGLVWEFVRTRDFRLDNALRAMVALAIGLIPLLTYGAYLARTKGSPFYFFTDQRLGWHRQFTDPVSSFTNTWRAAADPNNAANWRFAWSIEILAAGAGVALVLWALSRREWGYAAFMGTTLASLMTSTWYFSVPRMLLSFFPAALFLAAASARDERLHESILVWFVALSALGVVVFTRSAWFY
ncbi:MAG TPA: mannosyltransferase family protein [Actinomycetota bacterium]|nr:mannosyltransferase family protein [Actinomycetota bacterium]